MKFIHFIIVLFLTVGTSSVFANSQYTAPALPTISDRIFNIKDFGAISDTVKDNAVAIQSAIDAAEKAGGGRVVVPAGIYLSGPLTLGSNIDLRVEKNAVLKLLPINRYPGGLKNCKPFITGVDLHDIAITGQGKIDGQGIPWWPYHLTVGATRPKMIVLNGCNRVLVKDITLKNSPMFNLAIRAENVTVRGITILAPASTDPVHPSFNTDACNISGHHILVENSYISNGDDDYTCGGGTSDVMIRNNSFGNGHGVSIGSPTHGGVSNITVENCTFENTDYGIRIKSDRDRGGVVENLTYRNLKMKNVGMPILIYAAYKTTYNVPENPYQNLQTLTAANVLAYPKVAFCKSTPVYRNIVFENIRATVKKGGRAGLIWGLPESKVSNIILKNVRIDADLPFGIYFADNVMIKDCKVETDKGLNLFDLTNATATFDGK